MAANLHRIDLVSFSKRLKAFYSHWYTYQTELWGASTALVIATPPPSDLLRYLKSSALHLWLFGHDFPETIMVFMKKQIHILCSQKNASLLDAVKKAAGIEVVIHVKAKSDSGSKIMDGILNSVARTKSAGNGVPVVGYISRETPEGKLLEMWDEKLKKQKFEFRDVSIGFSDLLAVKDETEVVYVRKAASWTSAVMEKFVVPELLENAIDEGRKVSHSLLMEETEKVITQTSRLNEELREKLRAEVKEIPGTNDVDICYSPIFQSGGDFDLKLGALSNSKNLYYAPTSVIICAIGSRYKNYCSNAARTFLIEADDTQCKAYEVLLKAHEAAVGALKRGNKASSVYQAAISVVEKNAPELSAHLTKTAGSGIGLEFRESGLSLNAKNDRDLKPGMVFNVALGFHNLQSETNNPRTSKFSLFLADTVIVEEKGSRVLTCSPKALKEVNYSFAEENLKVESDIFSKAKLRSENHVMSREVLRKQNQAKLALQKNEETAMRLAGGGNAATANRGAIKTVGDLAAYKNVNDLPSPREFMIQIDQKHDAILLPIHGTMIPFLVATVKSVSSQQDSNRTSHIRIMFNVPGTPFNPHDANSLKFQGSIYLKEVSFRSKDSRHITEVVQQIKTLRRQVSSRESERAERATLVTQERLQLASSKFKPIKVLDLWIRPVFGGRGRKLTGSLEAHANGFRYSTSRPEERVDVLYSNIKHAFFQPADKEMITLLHFHLHNHIMVGNKKTKDVQFYIEVMETAQTLGGSGKRSLHDPDEMEEEERERDRKNRINLNFQNFVTRINELWKPLDLEFDQPMRELGFHGVPHKASTFVVPTSTCLVELNEMPFLVVTLSEIEIVNFERVGLGQKSFDMAIVFKDFKRDVLRIDSIPSSSLDGIKEWLNITDLKYYESRFNLSWKPVLKNITDNPKEFIEDGGWEFLNNEAPDSEPEKSEDSDKGYVPSDMDSESGSDDEDEDSASLVESEDESDEGSEEEEEEGKSWDELEREACYADKEKGDDDSGSEEDRKRRKNMKVMAKSRVPVKRSNPRPSASLPKRPKFRR